MSAPPVERLSAEQTVVSGSVNTVRAPRKRGDARVVFDPVPITDLGPSAPPDWVWRAYAARGHITLLTALWKSGKTTLVCHLIRDLEQGGGLVPVPTGIKTLVVSEESTSMWTRRRDDLHLGGAVHIACRPFRGRPTMDDWLALIEMVAACVEVEGYGLVIFDTLPSLWPVTDENNAAEVGTALLPLHEITEEGAALLLVHHPRKGDATEGQASRGSGALPGMVDVIVEMRRNNSKNHRDRRRVLRGLSRFDETPAEAVVELTEAGYVMLGERADARQGDRLAVIDGLLPADGPGLTADEVVVAWPSQSRPGKRTVEVDLAAGTMRGRWERTGNGRRGDPFRYRRRAESVVRTPTLLEARNESAGPTENNGGGGRGP